MEKSRILGRMVLARCLTPGDPWNVTTAGWESGSARLHPDEQGDAHVFNSGSVSELEPRGGYRFIDSVTRCGITHDPERYAAQGFEFKRKGGDGARSVPAGLV